MNEEHTPHKFLVYASAHALAQRLAAAGFKALHVSEPKPYEDGEVSFGNVYVQVPLGLGRPSVNAVQPGPVFVHGDPCDTFEELVADIEAAQRDGDNWSGEPAISREPSRFW